jgi:Zn-finger nucleic acid-binding protein
VPIHTCEACGGELIGSEQLARIVRSRRQRRGPQHGDTLAGHRPCFSGTVARPQRALACPFCEGSMHVVNYGGDSGVFVDRCGICETMWLDHKELEKVQIVMEKWAGEAPAHLQAIAGELEQARRKAADDTRGAFCGARFSFVNAVVNRFLDAA